MRLPIDKKYLQISLYVIFTVISIYLLILAINSILFLIINFKSIVINIFNIIKYFIKLFSTVIIAFVISYILDPIVEFFQKYYNKVYLRYFSKKYNIQNNNKIKKRTEGTILTYIFIFVIFIFLSFILFNKINLDNNNFKESITFSFNSISKKFNNLNLKFIEILQSLNLPKNIYKYIEKLTIYFDDTANRLFFSFIKSITSFSINIINFILSLVIAFYIMENKYYIKKLILKFINLFFNTKIKKVIIDFFKDVNYIFIRYIKCQIVDSIILSILISIVLYIINIKFAIEIGIISGLLNIVPFVGMIIGIILASISTLLNEEYIKTIYSILSILLLYQLDAIFISPKILGNVIKLNPAIIIVIILISAKLFGIIGVMLCIPVFSLIKIIFLKFIKNYKKSY